MAESILSLKDVGVYHQENMIQILNQKLFKLLEAIRDIYEALFQLCTKQDMMKLF